MAPPKQQPSLAGQRAIKHLVVDTGALIAAPVSSLRETATNYLVTSDVVQELRDKRGRNVLEEAKLQLPADTVPQEGTADKDELFRENEGFQVRDPTPESVAKSAFIVRRIPKCTSPD
jgi:RNA-binding protein NOB1